MVVGIQTQKCVSKYTEFQITYYNAQIIVYRVCYTLRDP